MYKKNCSSVYYSIVPVLPVYNIIFYPVRGFPGSGILLSYRVEYLFFFCLLREFVQFAWTNRLIHRCCFFSFPAM